MTSDTHDFLVRPGYWTPLNRIFSSQFIESEEEKIFTSQRKNYCRPKRSTVKYKKNVYNEKYSTDDSKMLTSDESNSSGDDKHSTVKHKKNTTKKSYSSDEWEIPTHDELDSSENDTSDGSDSSEERKSFDSDYGVAPKKRKKQKSEIIELSEYEKMIQKNKDEKIAFLNSLKMDEVKKDLKEAMQNLKPKRKFKSQKRLEAADLSTRKSSRERKVKIANLSKVLYEDEDANEEVLPPKILPFEEAISENFIYADFACEYEDLDFKTPKPFTNYVSCFKKMNINKTKITTVIRKNCSGITAIALHPMKEKVIVTAGDRNGTISFCHMISKSVPYEFKTHIASVSCLKFNPDSMNHIFSCSHDGTMRCGDMEKKVFTQVFNISRKSTFNYFDFISPTTTVICHQNGRISIVDIRSDSKSARKSFQCHDDSVETVSVHPVKKNYFVSADLQGIISVWDLRKMGAQAVGKLNHHKKNIISAFFSPISGNSILTTSIDESVCLFDSSKLWKISLDRQIRHDNKIFTNKALKAVWLPNIDDAFVIGSLEYPRRIQIFNDQLDNIHNFQNEKHFNCITSNNVFHPSMPLLAGGSSSGGRVFIFS